MASAKVGGGTWFINSQSIRFSLQVLHLPRSPPNLDLTSDLPLVILFLILKTLSPVVINSY